MQLHRTECECTFSVLWLFLATGACYLNCLSVRSLHTHCEHWQNLLQFFSVFLLQTNTTHSTSSTSGSRHNCREADCFQATPTPLMCPQYVCITLHYQPFSLNTVSPFPSPHNTVSPFPSPHNTVSPFLFPHNAVQTSLTAYVNINKSHNFIQLASEISGMNWQGHPSNWNRDTTENVHCCSGTVPFIVDQSISNIQRS
jgi:hypothetical protein